MDAHDGHARHDGHSRRRLTGLGTAAWRNAGSDGLPAARPDGPRADRSGTDWTWANGTWNDRSGTDSLPEHARPTRPANCASASAHAQELSCGDRAASERGAPRGCQGQLRALRGGNGTLYDRAPAWPPHEAARFLPARRGPWP